MRLLLDQSSTVHHLDAAGVESARVREKELATASDAEIIDFARQDGRIVVTLDANSAADVIRAQFDMRPQLLEANAQVVENNGRVAVHAARSCIVWRNRRAGRRSSEGCGVELGREIRRAIPGRISQGSARRNYPAAPCRCAFWRISEHSPLYFRYSQEPRKSRTVSLAFILYYGWANRTGTPMQV